jgi:hypothetical protein
VRKSRRMREAAQLERNGAIKNACMGNVKRKCHRWDNNIKVDFKGLP